MADACLGLARKMRCSVPEQLQQHVATLVVQFSSALLHVVSRAALNMGISKIVFLVYRAIITLLLLVSFAYFLEKNKRPAITMNILVQFFLLALVGITANQGFYLLGLDNTSPTIASAVSNSVPAANFLMNAIIGIDKVPWNKKDGITKVSGLACIVIGATVIMQFKGPTTGARPQRHNTSLSFSSTSSVLSQLGNAEGKNWKLRCMFLFSHCLSWWGWLILQVPVLEHYNQAPLSAMSYMWFFGLVQFLAISAFVGRDARAWLAHSGAEAFSIFCAGAVSGVKLALQIPRMKRRGTVLAAMYQPRETLLVAIISSIALGEQFYLGGIFGALLIIVGLYLVLWWEEERRKRLRNRDGRGGIV